MNESKQPVIENIKKYSASGELNHKVELGDPAFSIEESAKMIEKFYNLRKQKTFAMKRKAAYAMAEKASAAFVKDLEIVGADKITGHISGGAIITSNHFNPMDTMLPLALAKQFQKRLFIVSQDTNLALPAPLNFITNYTDLLPLPRTPNAVAKSFKPHLAEALAGGDFVLIYPEEEMWFNYRKPRPTKRGAYQFAAELNVPIISCFTEMLDTDEKDSDEFNRVKFCFHVLGILEPNPALSARENSKLLAEKDYQMKVKAYEEVYGKPLSYEFEKTDIAGWQSD